MALALQLKDRDEETSLFANRVIVLFMLALLMILGLMLRMVQLQVWDFDTHAARSDQNRIQVQPLAPPRGLIYDRNGVLIAENRPVFSLDLVRERVGDFDALLQTLRAIVEIDDQHVEAFEERLSRRRRPYEPVALRFGLTEEEKARVAVNRHRLPGVLVSAQLVRHYPFGALASHAVGSVRRLSEEDLNRVDNVNYSATKFMGKRGVERFYERSLHGEVGHQRVEIDARGRIRRVLDVHSPVAGQNITLHMDSRLQIAAHGALGLRRGAIVALDPKTGGVLAMVSNPSYDPNEFVLGISEEGYREITESRDVPLFNRAINGQYSPGSTFKPVVGLAGLSSGVLTWDETMEDRGWFQLPNQERIYRDWSWKTNNSGGQGTVDLRRAIYRSSNVFFYDLATRMSVETLTGFAEQFGIGQTLAADIGEASAGLLPDPIWKQGAKGEVWYPGDSVNMGIGQGDLLVTPLQLAQVAAAIANRGRMVRAHMLLASDQPLVEFDPPPPLPLIQGPTPDDWERMVDAMEDVVHRGNQGFGQNGTAWAYIGRGISYRMAAKSGTAQVVEIRQGEEYDEEELTEYQRKHAWFMAFAPADDPVIALSVLVENGGGGSSVAGPVAREVLDAYLLPNVAQR